jgi:hypothetical protein
VTRIVGTLLLLLVPGSVAAGSAEWIPGSTYDPRVPTIQKVLGFEPGTRLTTFYETEKLLHAWAQAAPDRCRLIEYGVDYEGKKLYHLVISSPKNIQNLEAIRQRLGSLADPRRLAGPAELDSIIESTPASFLISTVDTAEASSVEAMQILVYHLLAGTDTETERLLQDLIVHIVPVENPSSRERYVAWYNTEMSAIPKSDPQASEHQRPWGVGNDGNHYQLDPNRDGVSMLLRETRKKARMMRHWYPQVALDLHEMGVNSPFFFPPYPEPHNTNLPIDMFKKWWDIYATDLRSTFDRQGWRYFSLDAFGSPFLGMHTLYTQYLGAIGVLFEQAAGSGGIVVERGNGTLLTLRERIPHHVPGSISMLRVTAENREARHRDFHEFFRSSMKGVPGFDRKQYVFVPGPDVHQMSDFVDKLLAHGIEVERSTEPFKSQSAYNYFGSGPVAHEFPAGSYIVSLSQPLSRLANAVLEKEPHHSVAVFYDVSVWALPYNYGVDAWWTDDAPAVRTEPVRSLPDVQGRLRGGQARVAYAWSYGNEGAAAAFQLASEGFHLYVYPRGFKQGEVSFEPGAVLAFLDENDRELLHKRIPALAAERRIEIVALHSSYLQDDSDLGSASLVPMIRNPSVAIVTKDGVNSTAYGSFWFMFDQQYGLPFTPLTIQTLREARLGRYTTIIIPDGGRTFGRGGASGRGYTEYFGEEGAARVERWVREGGTLIAIKGGADWAIETGLSNAKPRARTEQTPGAIVKLRVARQTPLTAGFPQEFYALARNTRVFMANSPREALLTYVDGNLRIAGHLTEGDHTSLAGSDYLIVNRLDHGRVILFAEEPNLRNQWPVLHRLLFNAILLGHAVN